MTASTEMRHVLTEKDLTSPKTTEDFEQFLIRLERQKLNEHTGGAKSKNLLTKELQVERTRLLNYFAKQSAKAKQKVLIEKCWATKGRYSKKTGNVDLEVVKVYPQNFKNIPPGRRHLPQYDPRTIVQITATNTSNSRILRPRNKTYFEAIGTSMSDSFGNRYKLSKVTPEYINDERPGIRPGETKVFTLSFVGEPLRNAKTIRISIKTGAYGQKENVRLDIPSAAFFCAWQK
ncbi:MAG: hypothetical protein ISR51_08650 [Rhodospirillales bacterium]|nr:hypothetical protein [Rhodospirillales bacterium]